MSTDTASRYSTAFVNGGSAFIKNVLKIFNRRDKCNMCKRPQERDYRSQTDPHPPSIPTGHAESQRPTTRKSPASPVATKTPTSLREHFEKLQVHNIGCKMQIMTSQWVDLEKKIDNPLTFGLSTYAYWLMGHDMPQMCKAGENNIIHPKDNYLKICPRPSTDSPWLMGLMAGSWSWFEVIGGLRAISYFCLFFLANFYKGIYPNFVLLRGTAKIETTLLNLMKGGA